VDSEQAAAQARQVRAAFADFERRQYGREWSLSDLVGGLATDVGDLARLIAAAGVRAGHERAEGLARAAGPAAARAGGRQR
jgi:hypothetical protein